VKIDIFKA